MNQYCMQIKLDKNQLSHIRHTIALHFMLTNGRKSVKYCFKSIDEHSKGRRSRGCRKSFDGGGGSDLHKYAKSGNLKEIERCLDRYKGVYNIVKLIFFTFLTSSDCDVNVEDGNGDTPLIAATSAGNYMALEKLLKGKAKKDKQN